MPKHKDASKDPNKDINWPQLLEKAKEQPISLYVVIPTSHPFAKTYTIAHGKLTHRTMLHSDTLGLTNIEMPQEPPDSSKRLNARLDLPCEYKIHFNYWDAWKELCLKNRKKS